MEENQEIRIWLKLLLFSFSLNPYDPSTTYPNLTRQSSSRKHELLELYVRT